MKSPPIQIHDDIAFNRVEAFIRGRGQRDPRRHRDAVPGASGPCQGGRSPPSASSPDAPAPPSGRRDRPDRIRGPAAPAPHRREGRARRLRARTAVVAYRVASWTWATSRSAGGPSSAAGSRPATGAWPARRHLRANAGHVLGVPPDDRPRRALARAVYRNYARYPGADAPAAAPRRNGPPSRPRGAESFHERVQRLEGADRRGRPPRQQRDGRGRAGGRGWPIYGVADDTAFPELFELLLQERGAGASRDPLAQPARRVPRPAPARDRGPAGRLGLPADGIPVRLFGAWTTLPAGPAVLAARTGATIVPFSVIRAGNAT